MQKRIEGREGRTKEGEQEREEWGGKMIWIRREEGRKEEGRKDVRKESLGTFLI
jgi:hypothetical protein